MKRLNPDDNDETNRRLFINNRSGIFNNVTLPYLQNTRQTKPEFNLKLKDCIKHPPPMNLKLEKTSIKSKQSIMNARHGTTKNAQVIHIPADIFPASVLEIGEFKITATEEDTLVVVISYEKKKLGWEIFDKDHQIKYKLEMPWQEILAMRAILEQNKPGILEIQLAKVPRFFHYMNPVPRYHPKWEPSKDFTGGHASNYRRYYFEFGPGILDKYYQKLIEYDNRLLELSQQTFPELSSPFFDSCPLLDQGATNSCHVLCESQTNPSSNHDHATLPISSQQTFHIDNQEMSSSSLMHSTLPTLGENIVIQPPYDGNEFIHSLLPDPDLTTGQEGAFQMLYPFENEQLYCGQHAQDMSDNILLTDPAAMENLQQSSDLYVL